MASKMNEFPKTRGGKRLYPWKEWLNGDVWRLTPGTDFDASSESFRNTALASASRYGKRLRTAVVDGDLIIQASPR